MRMFSGVRPVLASLIVLSAALTSAKAMDLVTISLTPTAAYFPIYVAEAKGYFKQEGVDAKLVNTALATDAISMAALGQTDVGGAATGAALFNAAAKGLGFKLVMAMAIHPAPTTVIPLLIRKDLWDQGTVRSGKDLRGRTISTNSPGGSIEYKLDLILQKYGMKLSDVRGISIGMPETITALRKGALDAAILGEPYATEAIKENSAVMQKDDSAAAVGDLGTAVIFSQDFMAKHHNVAVRVTKALIRAAGDLQGEKERSETNVKILADALKLSQATVREMAFPNFAPDLSPLSFDKSLEHQAEVQAKNKRISASTAAVVPNMIDNSFVAEAMK